MNQLIFKTTYNCDLNFRYPQSSSRFGEQDYSGIPLIMHSNGTICWEATDYILYRLNLNLSLAKSTLITYAKHLSRSIAFVDKYKISLRDLTDYHLFDLVKYLQDPQYSNSGKPADNNQVNAILASLFNLLIFLQSTGRLPQKTISTDLQVIGKINVEILKHKPYSNRLISYFGHPARLPAKNITKRHPISEDAIETLLGAIYEFTANEYIHERWQCLMSILEHTGAREDEISQLKISSISQCIEQIKEGTTPRLMIRTNKGKNHGKIREVPIPKTVIQEINDFIVTYRAEVIASAKKNKTLSDDHGFIFTTESGSRRLTGKRISDHFAEVRNSTEIKKTDASPHMFRHRFITIQVKTRLKKFMEKNKNYRSGLDDFIIKRVKQLTGHVSDSSLWGYVDDALSELDVFKDIEEKIQINANQLAIRRKTSALLEKARSTKSTKEKATILDKLITLTLE